MSGRKGRRKKRGIKIFLLSIRIHPKSANGLKAMHVGVRRVRVRASERLASWQIDVEGWAQVISTNE